MSRFFRWGVTVLTMASVATLVLLVTGWGSAIASSVQSVIVANTAANPVPVAPTGTVPVHEQGTAKVQEQNVDGHGNIKVHEQGTANVNVTNTTALPVNGSVSVSGTPSVNATQADNPAFSAVAGSAELGLPNGGGADVLAETDDSFPGPFRVPSGKELVIQNVTFRATLAPGSDVLSAGVAGDVPTGEVDYLPTLSESHSTFQTEATGGGPTTVYVGPNQAVDFEAETTDSGQADFVFSFNGYLVNLP